MADVRVYEVVPGSLIVMRGVEYEGVTLEELMDGIERACGHRKFVIMSVPEGSDAIVLGPDDLIELLRDALGVDLDLPRHQVPTTFDLGKL